ncbi:HAD hydrolase-like protein [Erythrobacter sp. 3-20A1M]|uniref:HAD hydrolase-like protein n=1 Tax=Erythrobacter sp. 3-20A1M TaxID=2653850 RepID=UPI001BFC3238|nr:HAD hydrolase-like protein [Erythrobacter sp. 3-20A1M]QWC56053.1 HAD hydrolase-like protein [Erythrobacter sp. 3-20A1M]
MSEITSNIPFDIVGFDLDGTLLDTHRDLGEAVNHALREGGYRAVPVEEIEGLIGGGAKRMLARAIERQGGDMAREAFRPLYKSLLAYYEAHNTVHTRPYPGVEAVLDDLAARGIAMAVVTNKFEGFATNILTTLGLADRFETIIGGDSLGRDEDGNYRAKPMPDPLVEARRRCGGGRFAFVGDSSYDVGAARAAGVPVIVAGYGYCDRAPAELGGDAVVERFADIPAALARLGG